MMNLFDDAVQIEVEIHLPWAKKPIPPYGYTVDYREARESLAPLPKDREIYPWSAFAAQRQINRREKLINMISLQIADALINACESQDTECGYERKTNASNEGPTA